MLNHPSGKEKGLGVLSLLIFQLLGEVLSPGQTTNRIIYKNNVKRK
jgi:hypothetical protein